MSTAVWCQSLDPAIEREIDENAPAQSISSMLRLFRTLAQYDLPVRDELYSEEMMTRLFGPTVQPKVARGEELMIVSMSGFEWLHDASKGSTWGGPNKIFFEAGTSRQYDWSRMSMTFWTGAFPGRQFEEVTKVLGDDWIRDTWAERERDFAIGRESFNPPLPKSSHPMGRAIINYSAGKKTLVLEFSEAGDLARIGTVGGCLARQDCSKRRKSSPAH
jgi:hypothetical protein